MTSFTFHDIESAPEGSREALNNARQSLGFVPNLYAGLAESPAALEGYLALGEILGRSSLSPAEQQTVLLSVSAENGCAYCMAAHSTLARNRVKMDNIVVDALRDRTGLPDPKLDALSRFARAVVQERGWVRGPALDAVLGAGYSRQQVLDVILAVSMKTLSNYANHLLDTPVDAAFASESWSR